MSKCFFRRILLRGTSLRNAEKRTLDSSDFNKETATEVQFYEVFKYLFLSLQFLVDVWHNSSFTTFNADVLSQSRAEQSRAEQSRAEQSRAEQSRAEQSRAEQSRAEQSRAEQSRAEQSRAEQSRAEQSRAEQSRAEQLYI